MESKENPNTVKKGEPVKLNFSTNEEHDLGGLIPKAPDGGWGWVIVFSSFCVCVIIDGSIFSFGVLLPVLTDYFKSTTTDAAWVGSIFSGVYLLVGPIAGGCMNKFGTRPVMICGTLVLASASIASAWGTSLTYLMLVYSIIGGIGAGFTYIPAVIIVGYYFEKKRAIATGLSVAGSGLGTIIMPPFYNMLIQEFAWQGTMIISAGIFLQCAVVGCLMRPLPKPKASDLFVKRDSLFQPLDLNAQKTKNVDGDTGLPTKTMEAVHEEEKHRKTENYESGPKLSTMRVSGVAPKLSIAPRPELSRLLSQSKQITAGDYVRSVSRLASVTTKNPSDLETLTTCLATVKPKEFQRPFSRQDILYSGSIANLDEFHKAKKSYAAYRKDTVTIPQGVRMYEAPDGGVVLSPGKGRWHKLSHVIPEQIGNVITSMFDFKLLRTKKMIILSISNFLGFLGFYIPFVYTSSYAEALGYSRSNASLLLSIIGISNTAGRIFSGWVSDKKWLKAITISNWSLILCGLLTVLFPLYQLYPIIAVYGALFGFIIAAYITLTSIVLVEELGLENLTNSFGLVVLFRGFASILGSPLAGALYDGTGSYLASFVFGGVVVLSSGLLSYTIPMIDKASLKKGDHEPLNQQIDKILDILDDESSELND